jgi:hypothetical protein
MMKKFIISAVVSLLPCAAFPAGVVHGVGVGAIVGEPTGISAKKWISGTRAVDMAAAWSFSGTDSFQFHGDYLFHDFSLIRPEGMKGRLPVYTGIGMRLKLKDSNGDSNGRNAHDNVVGVRVPLGVTYLFENAPVDLFTEIVPIMEVAPDTDFDISAAFGARFYF